MTLLTILASVLAVAIAVIVVMYVLIPLFKGIGWFIRHVARFIAGEIGDALRVVGSLVAGVVLVPLIIASIVIGRWSRAAHYGRAMQREFATAGSCVYRIAIGHPARLLGLTALTEGIERRLPQVVAAAPGADAPSSRTGQFPGYRIVGSLAGGGSGGRLYVAEPDELRRAAFARAGQGDVDRVVIKSFSLRDGSSLPQIIRESRALDAARRLGLILEHELAEDRFLYVMRFVPGESLAIVTQQIHATSPAGGLGDRQLSDALSYAADLVRTLETYHRGGLWHKDVKPDNIIVDGQRAHLVDLGLITPLRSAMTLTTHGTEYFRDPEMVRLALRGVKVHDVDGARFDIYAAGAVLYSVVENSFPMHGGLSQITLRCPEALRWIIRRAMTDYDKRYPTAGAMLADLDAVRAAPDPFALRPADLPSMGAGSPGEPPLPDVAHVVAPHVEQILRPVAEAQPAAAPSPAPAQPQPRPRTRPKIRVTDWWTGRYVVEGDVPAPPPAPPRAGLGGLAFAAGIRNGRPFVDVVRGAADLDRPAGGPPRRTPRVPSPPRRSAADQLAAARARVKSTRARALARSQRLRSRHAQRSPSGMNAGVVIAVALTLGVVALGVFKAREAAGSGRARRLVSSMVEHRFAFPPAPPAPGHLALAAAPSAVPADGIVLVVRDLALTSPLSAEAARTIDRILDAMRASGLELAGDAPGADNGDDVDLVARAHNVRGVLPIGSEELARAFREWLDSDDAPADAVLWLSTFRRGDPSRPDPWHVVRVPHSSDREEVVRLKVVQRAIDTAISLLE